MLKPFLAGLALFSAMAGCDATPATAAAAARRPSPCRFLTPADLGTGAAVWFGSCPDGRANGAGVLRVEGDGAVRLFAGIMRNGRPERGYLDTGSAETTGVSVRFDGRNGLPPRNRTEIAQGCTVAADAATTVAARFERARNPHSAAFYRNWARALRTCVDHPDE